jgi:hypothetical protein
MREISPTIEPDVERGYQAERVFLSSADVREREEGQ